MFPFWSMHVSCQLRGVSLPSTLLHTPSAIMTCVGAQRAVLGDGPMPVLDAGGSPVTSLLSCLTDSGHKEHAPPLSRWCHRFLAFHTNRLIFRSAHVALISPRLNFPTMLFTSACSISRTKSRPKYMASKNSPVVTAARACRDSAAIATK